MESTGYSFWVNFLIILIFILALSIGISMHKRYRLGVLSPVAWFIFVHSISITAGYFFYSGSGYGVSVVLDADSYFYSGVVIQCLLVVISFSVGSLLIFYRNQKIEFSPDGFDIIKRLSSFDKSSLIGSVFVSLFIFLVGNGIDGFLTRNEYMVESYAAMKILGTVLALAVSFVVGINFYKTGQFFSWALIATVVLVELSYSSRMGMVSFVAFCVGLWISARNPLVKFLAISAALIVSPYLVHIALFMRGEFEQGLIPVVSHIITGDEIWTDFSLDTIANNTIFINFVITALTAKTSEINIDYILTSVNPLPGFMTDWYELEFGLNSATPYSSMGELLNFGFGFSLVFYALLGALYAKLDVLSRVNRFIFGVIGAVLFNISTITMLQYPTRSSLRMIFYFMSIVIFVKIYQASFARKCIKVAK